MFIISKIFRPDSARLLAPLPISLFVCFSVLAPTTALPQGDSSRPSQTNYVAFELARADNWDDLITEDVNGDGAKDIIISHYQADLGRELHIYHQKADGSFESTPQRIEVKTEIIAVGFADLRPEPGKELLLFASTGVYSLSTTSEGYAGNIKQLLQWDLIATIPDLERVQFIDRLVDIDNDGNIDLLLPGDGVFGYFRGNGAEGFELVSSFSTVNSNLIQSQRNNETDNELSASISINPEQGLVVELSTKRASPFGDFVEQWGQADIETRTLLRSEHWMPSVILAHLNSDQLLDIAYLNIGDDDLGQLNIHYQQSQSGFGEQPDWTGSIDTRGDILLVDMDQDQQMDLLRLTGDGSEWDARFFLNQGGSFNLDAPNQIMRFSGYDVRLNFITLEANSAPVLNVSYYTIPVVNVIRNASITRTQLLYGSDAREQGQVFNRRPDTRLEESFSATNVRGLSEQMSLDYDVDGDGIKDALYISENGTLAAKKIDSELRIAEIPFWEYISSHSVFEFKVLHLNSDSRPDLLLRHGTTTTLLVTTP